MACILGSRFNMSADILRQVGPTGDPINQVGEWVMQQDADTGEIVRKWQPGTRVDDPLTVQDESLDSFKCIARGIVDGGIRVAGTTERFNETFESDDYLIITCGAKVRISKRDRITNVRDSAGNIAWRDEERADAPPTVFNVMGVTPIPDPFGKIVEQRVLCSRADIG